MTLYFECQKESAKVAVGGTPYTEEPKAKDLVISYV